MTKAELIETRTEEAADYWLKALTISGSIIFMLLTAASYFVWSENFVDITMYNIPTALALYGIYQLAGIRKNRLHLFTLAAIAAVLSAAAIELIILSSGGHTSGYYVGMIILMIAMLGFIPFNLGWSISMSLAVYTIYLLPILFLDTVADTAGFIEKNIFMLAVISLAVIWRETIQRKTNESLELQFDLEANKDSVRNHQLKVSHALEVFSHIAEEVKKMKGLENYTYTPIRNYHIPTCWEVTKCSESECPVFGADHERCWQTEGTHCHGEVQGRFAEKFEECKKCQVYREATKDQMLELAESFNNMMHILENTQRELNDAYRTAEDAGKEWKMVNKIKDSLTMRMNNIIEMTAMLAESGLNGKQTGYVSALSENMKQLMVIVNELPELCDTEGGNGHKLYT